MKVYKWVHPYNENDKPAIKSSWEKSGIYIIKQNDKIVYVGQSGYNLYKTMYRHFQSWIVGKKELHIKQKVINEKI